MQLGPRRAMENDHFGGGLASSPQNRLRKVARALVAASAQQKPLPAASRRHVVSTSNALEAILLLASSIDSMALKGQMRTIDAEMIISLLMVVRDHIDPLPGGGERPDSDPIARDLEAIITMLIHGELEARNS
ncbi:hypothetical protein [Streptomyces sp. NBC_01614]